MNRPTQYEITHTENRMLVNSQWDDYFGEDFYDPYDPFWVPDEEGTEDDEID